MDGPFRDFFYSMYSARVSKVALWCHYVQKCVSYAMIYFYTLVLFLGRIFRSQARVGETANCGKEEYLKLQISKYEHQQAIAKACIFYQFYKG